MIKAIETRYRETLYRSRTEARWAAYLDELRVPYAYEPEGFDLDGDWYLPDFWLPKPGIWLEIKGIEPSDRELRCARLLTKASRCPVAIAVGVPSVSGEWNVQLFDRDNHYAACAFTGDSENVFLSSECQSAVHTMRGSVASLSGMPDPLTGAARAVQAMRFGVHESPAKPTSRAPIRGPRS